MRKKSPNVTLTQYHYDGPVMEFDRCIAHRWRGTTYAVSEKKARSNLVYQFKIETRRAPKSQITLPGKIEPGDGKEIR